MPAGAFWPSELSLPIAPDFKAYAADPFPYVTGRTWATHRHRMHIHRPARVFCAVLIAGTFCFPATAQSGQATGFAFMRIEPTARGAALGGSLSAVCCDDAGAFLYNPALLHEASDRNFAASYLKHLHDMSAGFVTYSRTFAPYGTAAVGVRFFYYGTFERADQAGQRSGTFSASDVVFTLGAGRHYAGNFRFGVNVHLVHSSVDRFSAQALLFDVGVAYHEPVGQLTATASLNNVGMVLSSLGNTADEAPIDLRLAIGKRLRYVPLRLSLTAYNLHDIGRTPQSGGTAAAIASHAIVGLEFQVISAFALRLGYNHRRHQNLTSSSRLDIAGAGVGFGLRIRGFTLDYAYSSWSFAGLHQFTAGTRI